MGCYCVKSKEIPVDVMINTNVREIEDLNKSHILLNVEFASRDSNNQKKLNTINTDSNAEFNNNNNNTNSMNQTNLADSVEWKKSSLHKKFEKEKTNKNLNLKEEEEIDFEKDMLNLINLIRKNPIFLVDKIISFMGKIKVDKNTNKNYFLLNKKTKISFVKGKEAFLSCCNYLRDLAQKINDKSISLSELELKEELKFPFPTENPDCCNNKEFITRNILEINKNLAEKKMRILGFHYDLSTNDAETSLILQVVDDNNSNGKRRNVIFDDKIKYIGISHGRVKDNIYCIYLLFAA